MKARWFFFWWSIIFSETLCWLKLKLCCALVLTKFFSGISLKQPNRKKCASGMWQTQLQGPARNPRCHCYGLTGHGVVHRGPDQVLTVVGWKSWNERGSGMFLHRPQVRWLKAFVLLLWLGDVLPWGVESPGKAPPFCALPWLTSKPCSAVLILTEVIC